MKPLTDKQERRTKLTKPVAEAVARAYCGNKRNKAQALLDNGYSESYARSGRREVVFRNVHVSEAIARIEAELSAKCGYTVQQAQKEYEEARLHAAQLKQPSAEVSAVTGKARLFGFDKDAGAKSDEPDKLSDADLATLRAMANTILDNSMKGPQLAQEPRKAETGTGSQPNVKTA